MSATSEFVRTLAVPRPSSGHLAALAESDRPLAVFSDFDGTIFLQDTGHVLFDNFGCGPEGRRKLDESIGETKTFREASEELWGSLNVTLPKAIAKLKETLVIDPDFYTFFSYLQQHNIPFTVISAGVEPLLRAALDEFLGKERSSQIEVISNNGTVTEDGKWSIQWRHDSPLGHDKAQSVKEWRVANSKEGQPPPKIVFIGDGVSDLAAASQADILFARRGLKLENYCIEHMIPYIPYDRFKDIIHDVRHLVKGNHYHDEKAAEDLRQARLAQLTGGLGMLTSTPDVDASSKPLKGAKFGMVEPYDDSDSDQDVAPVRPISPSSDPPYEVLNNEPVLSRRGSVGDLPC